MKKKTREWLEDLALTRNNSKAREILQHIEYLEHITLPLSKDNKTGLSARASKMIKNHDKRIKFTASELGLTK
jgi:hypothetical protein